MDRLKKTNFLQELTGKVFLSQYEAAVASRGKSFAGNDSSSFHPVMVTN